MKIVMIGAGATSLSSGRLTAAAAFEASAPEANLARDAKALWPDFAAAGEAQSDLFIQYRKNGARPMAGEGLGEAVFAADVAQDSQALARTGGGHDGAGRF